MTDTTIFQFSLFVDFSKATGLKRQSHLQLNKAWEKENKFQKLEMYD